MGQHDAQVGKLVEHTAKNEMRGGDRRLKRIAQQVGQIVRREPLMANHLHRMNEQRQTQLFKAGIDRKERRVRHLKFIDMG